MIKIRNSVFETNSSSTHSICIVKRNNDWEKELPKELIFKHEEYGWKECIYRDTQNKANYLYEAICALYDDKEKNKILEHIAEILYKYGVAVSFEPEKKDEYGFSYGYIDHPYGLNDFVKSVCTKEKKLLRYLFSEKSFVMTGNDNDGTDINIYVDYKHDEYYKDLY